MTKYEAAFTALLVCIACWRALKWAGRVAANRDDDLCFWLAACCYSPETSKSIEASEIFAVFGVKSNHSVNIWAMCYIFIFHLCFTSAVFIVSWVFFFMLVDHYSKFIIIFKIFVITCYTFIAPYSTKTPHIFHHLLQIGHFIVFNLLWKFFELNNLKITKCFPPRLHPKISSISTFLNTFYHQDLFHITAEERRQTYSSSSSSLAEIVLFA